MDIKMISLGKAVLFAAIGISLFNAGCSAEKKTEAPIPAQTAQMVLVITASDTATTGRLYCFERGETESSWKSVNQPVAVIVGGRGLAWGSGLHQKAEWMQPEKREGDQKSPAGVFTLDAVFGFAPAAASEFTMPYTPIDEMSECIDDESSAHYNRVVERDEIDQPDWQSSEKMIRAVPDYRLGVVVGHNRNPVEPGRGSCIFLHIWSDQNGVTYGCTAMASSDMEWVAGWLKQSGHPLLVQLTADHYRQLKNPWQLPEAENK